MTDAPAEQEAAWIIVESIRSPGRFIVKDRGRWVCCTEGPNAEREARLITAAPDMLAALREIRSALSAGNNDDKDAAIKEANANRAWHLADDALVRAEGRDV